MKCVLYSRVSSSKQSNESQISALKKDALKRNFKILKIFQETVSGYSPTDEKPQLINMIKFLKLNPDAFVFVSEISRLGRRTVEVLNLIEELRCSNITLYVSQINMFSNDIQTGKSNEFFNLLMQMFCIGGEMEYNALKSRQKRGIELARLQGKYEDRKTRGREDVAKFLEKHKDITELIQQKCSLRMISRVTKKSLNTVRKVNDIIRQY